jgi:t-SNARE complex subunit (syntaxin)
LHDLKQSVAEENQALAAGAKARRQRTIGIAIFFVILALFAVYAIIQILVR